jgi:hypothetical protein
LSSAVEAAVKIGTSVEDPEKDYTAVQLRENDPRRTRLRKDKSIHGGFIETVSTRATNEGRDNIESIKFIDEVNIHSLNDTKKLEKTTSFITEGKCLSNLSKSQTTKFCTNELQLILYKRYLECTLIQWRLSIYP